MNKNYLPSKQFVKKVIVIALLVVIVIITIKVIPSVRKNLAQNKLEKTLLVKDLVIQDNNQNGIQDWEEALWGLDPAGDGASNREYILNKRRQLNKDGIPEGELTENDRMAREFFALIVSLQQSGNLNDESMKNLAESIGSKVVATEIADIYTKEMLKVEGTTQATLRAYYTSLQKLNTKYKDRDIGGELSFIGQAIGNNDSEALKVAVLGAVDYREFGNDLMKMTVPNSLMDLHLELANNYEKNAKILESMNGVLENPVSGMASIIQYKRYNDALINTLEKMRTFFVRNAIIKE